MAAGSDGQTCGNGILHPENADQVGSQDAAQDSGEDDSDDSHRYDTAVALADLHRNRRGDGFGQDVYKRQEWSRWRPTGSSMTPWARL